MGKNKDRKRKAKHREQVPVGADMRFEMPPHVAGVAAAALKQVNTPAFRQMIAGALGAAAQAFDRQGPGARPDAPPPPPTPSAPPVPPAPPAAYAPNFETPEVRLSPEAAEAIEQAAQQAAQAIERVADSAARAVEAAAAGIERWVEKQAERTASTPER